jgi:hypothetical protein
MAKELKCSKCDRKFSMPAHLARHVAATHSKKRKAKAKRKVRRPASAAKKKKVRRPRGTKKRKVGRPKGRGAGRGTVRQLLSGLKKHHRDLVTQRGMLDAQIAAVTRAIKELQRT